MHIRLGENDWEGSRKAGQGGSGGLDTMEVKDTWAGVRGKLVFQLQVS